MKKYFLILLSISFLRLSNLFGWGSHYLVMDRSVKNPQMSFTNELVRVESLDSFINKNKTKLNHIFHNYYKWMQTSGKTSRINKDYFTKKFVINTQKDFFTSARLNTSYNASTINRIQPAEKRNFKPVKLSSISRYLHEKELRRVEFENVAGKKVSGLSVVRTFADEPDWGFDHGLFTFKEYGYGDQPYGKSKGESSKAPFHMQFLHENFIVRMFASKMTHGMVEERIELFQRLSTFSFKNGHRYWGYRFAAWAIHYIQDLAQPYHSKAVPHADLWYYIKFMFSFNKKEIKKETTQLLVNRHFLYEDFVAYGLEMSYSSENLLYTSLSSFLVNDNSESYYYPSLETNLDIMERVTSLAVSNAQNLDGSIVNAFGFSLTNDPSYNQESDETYSIKVAMKSMNKEKGKQLLRSTQIDFLNAGRATRTLLLKCIGKNPNS